MRRDPPATKHLTLARRSIPGHPVTGARGGFALRCLQAIARECAQSAAYYPFWIVASPPSTPPSGDTSEL